MQIRPVRIAFDSSVFRLSTVLRKLHGTGKRLAQHGLQIVGAWDYLDCLVGADDCPKAKPDPDPIVYGAQLLGLAPQECIYLGDSPYDMQAGIAAGCTTVAALWGMFPAEQLMAHNPAAACESFADFAELAAKLSSNQ